MWEWLCKLVSLCPCSQNKTGFIKRQTISSQILIFEHLYVVENRQIEVLVLLRKLPTFPTWQQRQGKAGRDCPRYNTDIGKSKRETHPGESGIAGKRSRQLRKQPGGKKEEGADARTQTWRQRKLLQRQVEKFLKQGQMRRKREKNNKEVVAPSAPTERNMLAIQTTAGRQPAICSEIQTNPSWMVSDCYFMDCVGVRACVCICSKYAFMRENAIKNVLHAWNFLAHDWPLYVFLFCIKPNQAPQGAALHLQSLQWQ